jgi:hypothetical protein
LGMSPDAASYGAKGESQRRRAWGRSKGRRGSGVPNHVDASLDAWKR